MADDLYVSSNFRQRLGDVFAEASQFGPFAIAARANDFGFMRDDFARREDLRQTVAENEAGQDAGRGRSAACITLIAPRAQHGSLPARLSRHEVVIDSEDAACPSRGGTMHRIGDLCTEQLDVVPTQLRVRVRRRPRYACQSCESAVMVSSAPERPIDGCMATEALIARGLVSNFCDLLPLYRQRGG